ncbi:hypothetical protein CDD81_5337 [Ophiocordyceps australis]|uniref:Uncharacterized protein n=1 Tax=Ophiocordyceps australis TaxID=1399860 RepID=A0A2C5XA37_9HYPO|nr:hypothetical protein CDD81_5337 [Ophiocordyceps australis]
MANVLVAQPNFRMAADGLRNAATEIERCQNMEAAVVSDQLLGMMQLLLDRFGTVETRLDGIDNRLEGIESRMGRLETRMDGLATRMDGLETRMDGIKTRMDGLETRFNSFEHQSAVWQKNLSSQIYNSNVMDDSVGLAPLYSFQTGELIPDFPSTLAALDAQLEDVVTGHLQHLSLDAPRLVPDRKTLLVRTIGVRYREVKN